MPVFKVKVKWGRELFPDIEVNTDEEPLLFKAQLFALTGVQPERQKIMCKGGILKDNTWNLQLKDGSTILLLGTKEQVPEVPSAPIKFVEDMNEAELATALDIPTGLTNLGNTCYMNATIQCLKSVPELCVALNQYDVNVSESGAMPIDIASAMKYLFKQMDKAKTVTPIILLQTLHRSSPQFSQTGENGTYRQQDANECWSELLKMLQQKLPSIKVIDDGKGGTKTHKSLIEQFFGGTFQVKMHCVEAPEEEVTQTSEDFLHLSCFISSEVKYMQAGLKSKMIEELNKHSEFLGRNASYKRCYLINRLPAYLTVQFVRFQYKGKEGINAKVLKDIKFPIDFDAYELCTSELQEKLLPMRAKFKEVEDLKVASCGKKDMLEPLTEKANDDDIFTEEEYWFDDDLGSNNSGFYTLKSVLTHKGRSSSSGHYVAWVRQNDENWFKFDDDIVTLVTTDEILRLSGGGDWHCAYVLLYGPKILKTPKENAVK